MELEHADSELLLEKPSRMGGGGGVDANDGFHAGDGNRRVDYKDRVFALSFGANVAVIAVIALIWGLPNVSSIYFTIHKDDASSSHGFKVLLILLSTSCIGGGVSALWLYVLQHHAAQVIAWTLRASIVVCVFASLVAFYDSGIGGRAIGFINLFLAVSIASYYNAIRPSVAFAASSLTTASRILQVFPALVTSSYMALVALGVWTLVWSIAVVGILAKGVAGYQQDITSYGNACFFFILLSFHWFVQVAKNVVHCVAAGTVGEWWFGSHDMNTIHRSQTRALTTSLGSICFGSLVVAVLNALEIVLLSTQRRKSGGSANACLECIVELVNRNLLYFNKYAFCQVALYGKDFRTAGSDTMRLFRDRGWSFLLNDSLISSVLAVGCLVVGILSGVIGSAWMFLTMQCTPVESEAYPGQCETFNVVVLTFVACASIGYAMCAIVSSILDSIVSTIFVCFAEDPAALQRSNPSEYAQLVDAWARLKPDLLAFPSHQFRHCDFSRSTRLATTTMTENGNVEATSAPSAFLTEVAPFATSASSNARPYEHDPEKGFTMDIMMMMDMEKVSALRKEFQVKENGLSISEFVFVMMKFVQSSPLDEENARLRNLSEQQLVANLCELFAQIDINGDGSMEWEEFTSFIVDTGLTVKSHQPNSIQHYHHVQWEDASKHSTFIDHIYYFPGNDLLALVENCSPLLKIYNVNCELVRTIRSPEGFVQCAEHIPRLDQFVLASSDLQFRFYDDSTLRLMKSCHTPTSQNCLKWYPETSTLFSAGVSGIVYAWDAERMEEKHHMGGEARGKVLTRSHDDIVLDLLSLPTLESLASASMDRTIRLWDVHTGKHKQQLDGHTKGVRSLAYSPEYRFLVSAGFDFDALVWNPYVDQLILRLHGHNNSLCGVEIIPDTPQIVTADVDGVFKVWDIRNFACMQTFSAENVGDVKKIVAINSQKRIVAAGKKLTKFDYEKLENPELTDDHPVFAALYNPTSLSFITAAGRDVKIWDARLGKLIRVYRGLSTTDLTSLCLDFRERKFIVGDHAGNIHVFDYLNGSHMKSFAYPELENRAHLSEVSRVCYCDEHMSVLSASWDCCIDIHDESDSERGVLLRRMSGGHAADISALCFSFHLSLIASASSDNSLQIWDYEFGRLEGTCIGHVSGVLALQFLDPFPLLLSSDAMGNLCFWAMRPCQQFKWKCVFRFRNQRSSSTASGAIGGGIASVTCMATQTTPSPYDPASFGSYLVIAGDDKGVISVWNVLPLLLKLDEDFRIRKLDKPVECTNPQRNLRVNASGMVRKFRNGPEWAAFTQRDPQASFFFLNGMPLLGEPQVPCVQQWQAHGDVVYSIQMIAEPQSVITSSFDRRVKIWTLSGECLGILMQGELELSVHKRPWKFSVDYDARERKKEGSSSQVIEDVHKLVEEDESGASRSSRNSARRRAERAAAAAATAAAAMASSSSSLSGFAMGAAATNQESEDVNVLEEITRGFLPPIGGHSNISNSSGGTPGLGPLRKTPRRKPVTAAGAGKSQFVSPRQLRVINRAGMSSPR